MVHFKHSTTRRFKMYSSLFWKDVSERAFFTALQVILGILTADGFDVLTVDVQGIVVAVVVAVLAVIVKAGVAANVSGTVSPASLAQDDRGV
jgi:hypothetical protein